MSLLVRGVDTWSFPSSWRGIILESSFMLAIVDRTTPRFVSTLTHEGFAGINASLDWWHQSADEDWLTNGLTGYISSVCELFEDVIVIPEDFSGAKSKPQWRWEPVLIIIIRASYGCPSARHQHDVLNFWSQL
jgi:hypothetical protein